MIIFKDKVGNKLTFKEFISRWQKGIEGITPIQKLKTQLTGTKIMLLGLFLGLCVSIYGWKNLWWVGIILIGALLNTGVQYLGLKQQKRLLDNLEKQFELPEEDLVSVVDGKERKGMSTMAFKLGKDIFEKEKEDKKKKPKVVIIDNNPLSIAGYAEEFPENWKKICNALEKDKGGKENEEKLLRKDRSIESSKVLDRSNNDRSRNFTPLFNLFSFA